MDYDNTNKGSFFKPRSNESYLVQGKLDSNSSEYRVAIIKATLPDGAVARDVYVKVGTLYENEKTNENMPDFSGPVTMPDQEKRRLACWKRTSKDGQTRFLSASIGDRTPMQQETTNDADEKVSLGNEPITEEDADDIPF
tara:strand:+ start:252 stop:671 length:420 start_codon:yes stop_codon:yes gene_type:complete